jgi:hypothetical protein
LIRVNTLALQRAIVAGPEEERGMFRINVGGIDRVLRIVVGLGLLALVFVGPKTPWGLIGIVPLMTGSLRMCPLYSLIGVNTCPMRK